MKDASGQHKQVPDAVKVFDLVFYKKQRAGGIT